MVGLRWLSALPRELPARHRELLILRTAWNTKAEYEWGQHVRIARGLGLTEAEIARVPDGPDAGWSSLEAALLRASDELHRESTISDATWAVLVADYDEAQLIEVCMVVGQYHLVAFTLKFSRGRERAGCQWLPVTVGSGAEVPQAEGAVVK